MVCCKSKSLASHRNFRQGPHSARNGQPTASLETENSPSPRRKNLAKLQIEGDLCPWLDFRALASMVAQPLGSSSGHMWNKITKLLIVVVPRRAAGDG